MRRLAERRVSVSLTMSKQNPPDSESRTFWPGGESL